MSFEFNQGHITLADGSRVEMTAADSDRLKCGEHPLWPGLNFAEMQDHPPQTNLPPTKASEV